MGRIRKRRNPTANNSNRVPMCCKKNNSTSLSILLTTGAYKKRIRDLMKNNKSLASELERAHIQVAAQKELLKNCVKDSHQMMYARAKLKDIATNIHQLVTDLDVVMGFLDVGSHLKNIKYNDQFGEDQLDLRMRIADPAVSVIEEASSIEETPTTDGSTTLDAAATNPPQPDDSPFHDRIDEHRESPVSGKESGNLCDFGSPGDESHLSLTPVLEICPVVYTARCSAGRNSRLSLKSAKTRVSENLPSKRTSQLPKKKSIESKESAMQISKDLVKTQKILSSPTKVTQVESRTNASSGDKPTMLNGFATFDPVGSAAGVNASPPSEFPDKINQTLVMCEDMELTEVIPSIPKSYVVSVDTQTVSTTVAKENYFQDGCKSSALENKMTQSEHENEHIPECESEDTLERKSAVADSQMISNQCTSIMSKKRFVNEKSVISNGDNAIGIKDVTDGVQTSPIALDDTEQSSTMGKNSTANREKRSTVASHSGLEKQNVLESKVSSGEENFLTPKSSADASNTALLKTDAQKSSGVKSAGMKKPSKGKSTELYNDKTHLLFCDLECDEKKDSSCQETDLNQRSKRSKNVQYHVFFSSESDSDSSISSPPPTTKPRRVSTCKSKRVTVIHKPRATPKSNTKRDRERSPLEADTEMKAVGNFKTTDSSILPDTASSSKKKPSHEPDRDIYDFDSSVSKTKKVLSAANLGNATLDTKSSINDKNKKFFLNKQNCKSTVSVTNTANSFPRSCSENVDKFNSNWTKQDTVEEADASGESVDSERELNSAGRKRVSFAALDSVYKFKRNSAVIYSDKRLTVQCTKKVVLSDSEESSASEPDEMKAEKEGKGETFTEGNKKGQYSAKKVRSESAKNHALQTKKIGECLEDKTVAEVDHNALIHSAATGGEMNLDEETEIYTFVPSKLPEVEKNDPVDCNTSMVTVRRSKNHEYSNSFDISNTDLQVIHASKLLSKPAENLETNKLLVENPPHSASLTPKSNSTESILFSLQAKQRVKDVKLSSNGKIIKKFAVNEHNKGISCSTVTNVLKSSKIAKSGNEQNNDDEDTVTGLSSIISELMKNKKTKTNREKDGMASEDRAENALPVDDILIIDNGKQANCRKKSILPKDTLKKHIKRSKSPKHRNPLGEKNGCVGSMKCNLKENEERVGLTANQVKAKAVPKRCSAFASQQNGGRESKCLNDDRPKRRSRPVCYKEPTLNKKMQRQS